MKFNSIVAAATVLASVAFGKVNVIEFEGTLEDHGEINGWFGPATDFRFRLEYDDTPLSHSQHEETGLAFYQFPDLWVTLDFGEFRLREQGTEVRVYSGYQGLYGFTFGNLFEFSKFGLQCPYYFGIYGSYIGVYLPQIAPTTSIGWVEANAPMSGDVISEYAYFHGLTESGSAVYFQDNGLESFTVREAPELSTGLLMALGLLLAMTKRTKL